MDDVKGEPIVFRTKTGPIVWVVSAVTAAVAMPTHPVLGTLALLLGLVALVAVRPRRGWS
jgi:hypothetical protein